MSFRRSISFACASLVASSLMACSESDTVVSVNLVASWDMTQKYNTATDGAQISPLADHDITFHVSQVGETPIDVTVFFPTTESAEVVDDDGIVTTPRKVAIKQQFFQRVTVPDGWKEGPTAIKLDPFEIQWGTDDTGAPLMMTLDIEEQAVDPDTGKAKIYEIDLKKNSAAAGYLHLVLPPPPAATEEPPPVADAGQDSGSTPTDGGSVTPGDAGSTPGDAAPPVGDAAGNPGDAAIPGDAAASGDAAVVTDAGDAGVPGDAE